MSKKQVLRKVFAMLTVFTMVFAVAVNVSAATHSTTTSYDMGSGIVTVTSTIDGIQSGEEVTYLAYNTKKGESPSSSNIIYIDQRTADGTIMDIEYSAKIEDVGSTLVKFGAERTTEIAPEEVGADRFSAVGIQVNIEGGSVLPDEYFMVGEEYTFTIVHGSEQVITALSYSIDNGATTNPVLPSEIISGATQSYYTTDKVQEGYVLNVTLGSKPGANTVTEVKRAAQFGTPELNNSNTATNNLIAFSKVAVADDVEVYEYGVLFSYEPNARFTEGVDWSGNVAGTINVDEVPDLENGGTKIIKTGVKKYKALGKGSDGSYAVKLVDGGSGYLTGATKYYITPYVVTGGDYLGLGAKYGPSAEF